MMIWYEELSEARTRLMMYRKLTRTHERQAFGHKVGFGMVLGWFWDGFGMVLGWF